MTTTNLIMEKGLWFSDVATLGSDTLMSSLARSYSILLVTCVGMLLTLLFAFLDRSFAVRIKNAAGQPIKEITTDARVMKFVGR